MAAHAPHADGRLILYLQPVPRENLLWGAVSRFYAESLALGATEAHMYHPHCSVVGFMEVGGQRTPVLQTIVETLGRWPLHECSVAVDKARFIEVTKDQAQIGVHTHGFRELAAALRDALAHHGVCVRQKPLDHMSLAYISRRIQGEDAAERRAALDTEQYAALARQIIRPDDDGGAWELVLLLQTRRAEILGDRHVFERLASWPLLQSGSSFNLSNV